MDTAANGAPHPVSRRDLLRYLGYGTVFVGSGSLLLTACSDKSPSGTATSDSVALQKGVREAAFDPMDAHSSGNGVSINLFWYVYEALYVGGIASPTTFKPQLAAAEPSQVDPTTYKVKLRSGATFHDGSAVTADDVAWSFQRVLGMGDKSFLQKYLVNFDSVTASGADEVTFKLKKPTALFMQRASCVKIMSKAAAGPPDPKSDVLNYKPIGSGPYKVTEADPKAICKLVKYDKYNGPYKSAFAANEIDISIITDGNARVAALQSGTVDAISAPLPTSVDSLKNTPDLTVAAPESFATHLFFVNSSKKPFNDVRVRQACMYAMDRDAIATVAYNGLAKVADTLVPTSNNDYAAPKTIYKRDVAKAKQLLADAGYAGGLTFELQVGTENAAMVAAGQLIQQQLKEAGITVNIRQGDTGGLYTRVTGGDYEAMYAGTSPALLGSADAEFVYRWLYYGSFADQYVYWHEPQRQQVETLLDQAVTATSDAEYKTIMAQVQDICAEFGPTQPVVHPSFVLAWNTKKTKALTPAPIGDLILAKDV